MTSRDNAALLMIKALYLRMWYTVRSSTAMTSTPLIMPAALRSTRPPSFPYSPQSTRRAVVQRPAIDCAAAKDDVGAVLPPEAGGKADGGGGMGEATTLRPAPCISVVIMGTMARVRTGIPATEDSDSTTTSLPSLHLAERAHFKPSSCTFLGSLWACDRGLGPKVAPPPFQSGERMDPCRDRPDFFCGRGLMPPPLTSPLVCSHHE